MNTLEDFYPTFQRPEEPKIQNYVFSDECAKVESTIKYSQYLSQRIIGEPGSQGVSGPVGMTGCQGMIGPTGYQGYAELEKLKKVLPVFME